MSVFTFERLMEEWGSNHESPDYLIERLFGEFKEYQEAIYHGDMAYAAHEIVDVANFCALLLNSLCKRHQLDPEKVFQAGVVKRQLRLAIGKDREIEQAVLRHILGR